MSTVWFDAEFNRLQSETKKFGQSISHPDIWSKYRKKGNFVVWKNTVFGLWDEREMSSIQQVHKQW